MFKDPIGIHGYVEVFVTKGKPSVKATGKRIHLPISNPYHSLYESIPHHEGKTEIDFSGVELVDKFEGKNIVVDQAKSRLIDAIEQGFMRVVGRMAIGDRGTIPSDSTTPKIPTADRTELFNEVFRNDIDLVTKTQVGTTTTTPGEFKIQFTTTFSALDVPVTSLSNQTNPAINEVGLIMLDAISGDPLPRGPVSAPNPHPADEQLFAMRAFKSVPFDQANELAITIRYTIGFE